MTGAVVPRAHDTGGARHASEVIGRILRAETVSAMAADMADFANTLGFPLVSVHDNICQDQLLLDESGSSVFETVFGWPSAMIGKWYDHHLIRSSKDADRCRSELMPFLSSVMHEAWSPCSESDIELRNLLNAMGVGCVVIVPVHQPGAVVSMVGWAGLIPVDSVELETLSPWLLTASHAFVDSLKRLPQSNEQGADYSLTRRQRQCLALAARGMTAKRAGAILGISPFTVQDHLKICARVLGARSKPQLIALAWEAGLLSASDTGANLPV